MRVAINTSPLNSGHKVRGVGFYTKTLIHELEKDNSLEVIEFTDPKKLSNIDIIHYPWFDLFFRTLPLKKISPTVITIHDVIPLVFSTHFPKGIKGKLNLFYQKLALRSCKFIITDSRASKKDITEYLKIKEEKIKVILLAAQENFRILPDAELIRIKNKLRLPDNYLLYVGDVNFTKNIPFLIRGFTELKRDKEFKDIKLVLVGEAFLKKVDDIDHPELEGIKEVNRLLKESNLESEVLRLGFVEISDLVGIYNLATIYVQPSLYEGFGFPVLEAMACGVPVVCSSASSLPEVGGNAAIYFDPNILEKFVSLLKEILNDKSLRRKLTELGLKQASIFSWEKVANETIEVYRQAIQ